MSQIVIGKSGGRNISIDLPVLLKSRALIQAGSGGGKSWLLRRIAEQLFGKVQVFIIDREGEFASLRERFGFVLAGHDGDTPTDIRSARLLAEKLLELRASAVCDLYEAFRKRPGDRRAWVRGFLEGVMDAPKKLWRPLVLIVDEAHLFCPQESPKAASMIEREMISGCKEAMVSLATTGRKREFCAIWATQRLAKLDKDASAELFNRFVGQTIEDVDVDRAADLMSVSKNEKAAFKKQLKDLKPGNFFGFGRAVSKNRILIRVGGVKTTHEAVSTKYAATQPPAPEKIRGLLPKLKDLPGEVEQKAKTEAELRLEIRTLKAKVVAAEKAQPPAARPAVSQAAARRPEPKVVTKVKELPVLSEKEYKRIHKLLCRMETVSGRLSKVGDLSSAMRSIEKELSGKLSDATQAAEKLRKSPPPPGPTPPQGRTTLPRRAIPMGPSPVRGKTADPDEKPLMKGERRILEVLAQFHPGARTKSQIGALAGFTPSGGTFGTYFSRLRKDGFLLEQGTSITITEKGLNFFADGLPPAPQSTEELLEMWRSKLMRGERKMLDVVVEKYPDPITKEELGEATVFTHTGGTFGTYLSTLRRNELVTVEGDQVRACDALFELQNA